MQTIGVSRVLLILLPTSRVWKEIIRTNFNDNYFSQLSPPRGGYSLRAALLFSSFLVSGADYHDLILVRWDSIPLHSAGCAENGI